MKLGEILFIVAMLGGLLIPSALCGQWWLFSVFMVFGVIFGLIEWMAVAKTDKTVSQKFWDFSKKNKAKGLIILIGMLIAWLALLYHLGYKMFQ